MYAIHLIKNILTPKERKKLIKDVQPLLLNGEEMQKLLPGIEYKPGKRTLADIQLHPDFKVVQQRVVDKINKYTKLNVGVCKSWIFLTKGEDKFWHTHPDADWAAVYYIRTLPFFNNGTLFRHGLFKAPQNSVIIFPSNLEHTAPTFPLRINRYTWGMDLINKNYLD
tara:strand:- start:17 stop:517 length:501 start_codon:yes stop_codon:yes gene_type:complete